MAQAKVAYQRRVAGLVSQQRIQLVAALSLTNLNPSEHDEPADCPACEGRGWLHGRTDVDWHANFDDDGRPEAMVIFYPDAYDCALCDLHLQGDELELADFDGAIDLPEADPYTGYEPDEDLWRDR